MFKLLDVTLTSTFPDVWIPRWSLKTALSFSLMMCLFAKATDLQMFLMKRLPFIRILIISLQYFDS